jgi:hypothetical protein
VGVVKRRVLRGLWRRLVGVGIIGPGSYGASASIMPSAALCTPCGAAFALPRSRVAVYLMYRPQTSTSSVHKIPIIPDDVALSRWRS